MKPTISLLVAAALVAGSPGSSGAARAAPRQAEVETRLARLRGTTPCDDPIGCARVSAELDEVVAWLLENARTSAPIAAAALGREVGRPHPDQRFLVEVGELLVRANPDRYAGLGLRALGRVDPASPALHPHWDDLFRLAHALCRHGDPAVLAEIDRIFLPTDERVVLMPDGMRLDGAQMSLFLYGAWGPTVEDHLVRLTRRPQHARRALWLLGHLGSPSSTSAVLDLVRSHPDDTTTLQAARFFLRLGGPDGRRAANLMHLYSDDNRLRAFWARVRLEAAMPPGELPGSALRRLPEPQETLGDDTDVRAALARDVATLGERFVWHARAVLESHYPLDPLVLRLHLVRSRMLHRVSDEALRDVAVLNEVLNGLELRRVRAAG